ncbi:hypothetical protein CRG98_032292 [Punica granatum]|uniref:Uncharacterized protein n=1 Tax=Punica granatum TaxID=22663 RepID=A0A2I0ITH9_PUNGR|nr:hypothetical protein CRG98_032292 [Punica granatum]
MSESDDGFGGGGDQIPSLLGFGASWQQDIPLPCRLVLLLAWVWTVVSSIFLGIIRSGPYVEPFLEGRNRGLEIHTSAQSHADPMIRWIRAQSDADPIIGGVWDLPSNNMYTRFRIDPTI